MAIIPPIEVPWTKTRSRPTASRRRSVAGPAFDRVRLTRMGRGSVAAGVEREQAEALAEAVVDEAEVVAPEQPAPELEDHGCVVGPRQLVVEPNPVLDLRVRHSLLLDKAPKSDLY